MKYDSINRRFIEVVEGRLTTFTAVREARRENTP